MYNPYSLDLVRFRHQELIAEADRRRIAKAARKAGRRRRAPAGRPDDTTVRGSATRPAVPLRG